MHLKSCEDTNKEITCAVCFGYLTESEPSLFPSVNNLSTWGATTFIWVSNSFLNRECEY